jgi:hypothetical protein
MLAQNFKTPADLKIKDVEFETLLKVLGKLERAEIAEPPAQARVKGSGNMLPKSAQFFDMAYIETEYDCGTAACILGWMIVEKPGIYDIYLKWSESLEPLFCPDNYAARHCRNPEMGAIAIRSFLTTGEPRWAEALAE